MTPLPAARPDTLSFYEQAVTAAVAHVFDHLDAPLDGEAVARAAGLSRFHFHRVFKGMVGESALALHRRLRFERAACQLIDGAPSVTDVALDAGYETHEAFTRAFRDRFGVPPSAFASQPDVPSPPTRLPTATGLHFGTPRRVPHFVTQETAMDIAIETRKPLRIGYLTHIGPYHLIGAVFHRLHAIAGQHQLHGPGVVTLAISYDDPETTPPEELRSEACISLADDTPLPDALDERVLPGGRYARARYEGAYPGLGDAWQRFAGQWLPSSGEQVSGGPCFEIYRVMDPETPENCVTDLYMRLAD